MDNPERKVRKPNPLDWIKIDEMLQMHCTGTETAAAIGVCPDTLYDRTLQEKGILFSEYSLKMKEKGNTYLRAAQRDKAIKSKDSTMLIWLGKHWLKQKEVVEHTIDPQSIAASNAIKEQLAKAREALASKLDKI